MQIDVKIDSTELITRMNNGTRRLAYAVVNAINNTALRIQTAEYQHVSESFVIRKPQFWFGKAHTAAKIKPKASVGYGRAYAEIAMEAPAGRGRFDRRLLGPLFETGGIRTPFWPGAKQVAVPLTGGPARPTFASQITPALTFAKMRLVRHRYGQKVRRAGQHGARKDSGLYDTSGALRIPTRGEGGVQFKGTSRTFMIVKPEGGGTVFQRMGPGEITPVYVLRQPMRLRPRLHWISTAQQVAETWFPEEMEREIVNAIARAKGGGL